MAAISAPAWPETRRAGQRVGGAAVRRSLQTQVGRAGQSPDPPLTFLLAASDTCFLPQVIGPTQSCRGRHLPALRPPRLCTAPAPRPTWRVRVCVPCTPVSQAHHMHCSSLWPRAFAHAAAGREGCEVSFCSLSPVSGQPLRLPLTPAPRACHSPGGVLGAGTQQTLRL